MHGLSKVGHGPATSPAEKQMNYREMTALASDPVRVRATAEFILANGRPDASGAHAFLAQLANYDGSKPLTTRQLETLYSLRERASRQSKVGRYRAGALIRTAWERRLDLLDDAAEAWLDQLHARGPETALSRSEWRRLFALCRRLDIINPDEWVEFA
jgi:hypothetical protein